MDIKDYFFKLLKITPSSVSINYVYWEQERFHIQVYAKNSRDNLVSIDKLSTIPHTYCIYCSTDCTDSKLVSLTSEEIAIVDQRLFELWNEARSKIWDKFKQFVDERQ